MPDFKDFLLEALYRPTNAQAERQAGLGKAMFTNPTNITGFGSGLANVLDRGLGGMLVGGASNLERNAADRKAEAYKAALMPFVADSGNSNSGNPSDLDPDPRFAPNPQPTPQPPARIPQQRTGIVVQPPKLAGALTGGEDTSSLMGGAGNDTIAQGQFIPTGDRGTVGPGGGGSPPVSPVVKDGTVYSKPAHGVTMEGAMKFMSDPNISDEIKGEFFKYLREQSKPDTIDYGEGKVEVPAGGGPAKYVPGKPTYSENPMFGHQTGPSGDVSLNVPGAGQGETPDQTARRMSTLKEIYKAQGGNLGEREASKTTPLAAVKVAQDSIISDINEGNAAVAYKKSLGALEGVPEWKSFENDVKGKYGPVVRDFSRLVYSVTGKNILADKGNVALEEALRGIGADLASSAVHGLTNRPTEFDVRLFFDAKPNINQSKEGFKMIRQYLKDKIRITEGLADLGTHHFDRRDPEAYYAAKRKFLEDPKNKLTLKYMGVPIEEISAVLKENPGMTAEKAAEIAKDNAVAKRIKKGPAEGEKAENKDTTRISKSGKRQKQIAPNVWQDIE